MSRRVRWFKDKGFGAKFTARRLPVQLVYTEKHENRKSTDSEERQVLSIESQLAELKEFAAKVLGVSIENLLK